MLNFVLDDVWAPYTFAYQGERIISEKFGNPPSIRNFRKLLTGLILPSELM
jgi:hypothetical protein